MGGELIKLQLSHNHTPITVAVDPTTSDWEEDSHENFIA
jgi:hypothetical protein